MDEHIEKVDETPETSAIAQSIEAGSSHHQALTNQSKENHCEVKVEIENETKVKEKSKTFAKFGRLIKFANRTTKHTEAD